jgi:short-subunit dehydrogenase
MNIDFKFKNTVITGANSGIGFAFAETLAKSGCNLLLISKNENKLFNISDMLSAKYGVKIYPLCIDLRASDSLEYIHQYIISNDFIPDLFINNAGIGWYGSSSDMTTNNINDIIDINIRASTHLLRFLSSIMMDCGGGTIVNVSSTLAFRPSSDWAVYSASKNYICSLSNSLRYIFFNTNINIKLLCPGKTKTNFDATAGMNNFGDPRGHTPDYVANYALTMLSKKSFLIIPGFFNKIKYYLFKLLPDQIIDILIKFYNR